MRLRLLALPVFAAALASAGAPAAEHDDARAELLRAVGRLVQPVITPPGEAEAWFVELQGDLLGRKGTASFAWDGRRCAASLAAGDLPSVSAGFGERECWLHLPGKNKLFVAEYGETPGSPGAPGSASPLAECRVLPILKRQAAVAYAGLAFGALPKSISLVKDGPGAFTVSNGSDVTVRLTQGDGGVKLTSEGEFPGSVEIKLCEQRPAADLAPMLRRPAAGTVEAVDAAELRAMFSTAVDYVCEGILQRIVPNSVPSPLADLSTRHGRVVVRLGGTPEEMGRQHGTLLREAVRYNLHRVLHGVGLAVTAQTGRWFPKDLAGIWKRQEPYVPERFIREIDAMADAAGVPRSWARMANAFPERFHCSGMALRGSATVGGRLYHGRVLDYMTDVGLQNAAVVAVVTPKDGHAWVNVGYAGFCGTVTAMNEKGLAIGQMGGRGEGYVDGMPMSMMLREIAERFETAADALAWMKGVPRTCEYFYVLSDARTRDMACVASYAPGLAEQLGVADFQVVAPGQAHSLLPRAFADTVLMSAGDRYTCLADRVEQRRGQFDMQGAWDLMLSPVAARTNLHTVLFAPETLDFWAAEAGPLGEPACTQPIAKLNLKQLLARAPKQGAIP